MSWFSAIPLVGKFIDNLFGIIDQKVEDKDEANRLKQQIEMALQKADLTKFETQMKSQASIITAEAQGESWLQRNWRPMFMCILMLIIGNNYILAPYLDALFGWSVTLELEPHFWELVKLGLGGYIVGRSAEKGLKIWKNKDPKELVR